MSEAEESRGVSAPGVLGGLVRGAGQAVAGLARGLMPRFSAGSLDDRDPDYAREVLPALWLLASAWYRGDVRGLHHVPREGPVLLVGNHTGGSLAPEVFVFTLAFSSFFGVERPFYQLAHRLVVSSQTGALLRRFGTIEADPRNAELALRSGAAVLVFPGGDHEVFRPSWESAKVGFGGRKGWLRLALANDVPIVPVVTIGGQETALFVTRGERLSSMLGLDRLLRLKTLPIVIGPPFGLNSALPTWIPLPAKVTIQVMEPIDLKDRYGEDPDLQEVYDDVLAHMQDVLSELQRERRLPVLG
jgi:1-acyl-sn-glycerol-3-phosphate acyltransferase